MHAALLLVCDSLSSLLAEQGALLRNGVLITSAASLPLLWLYGMLVPVLAGRLPLDGWDWAAILGTIHDDHLRSELAAALYAEPDPTVRAQLAGMLHTEMALQSGGPSATWVQAPLPIAQAAGGRDNGGLLLRRTG